ncbi:MAG: hypothetical protein QXK78_05080 [Candidatus Bathyarchaeia archaeon]
MSVDDMVRAYCVAERILRGDAYASQIVWNEEVRGRFIEWMRANGRTPEYIADCVRYLDRYMRAVEGPSDVVEIFSRCERGKPHLAKAFRALLNYYEAVGGSADLLEQLRGAVAMLE